MKKILVSGATGNTGFPTVQALSSYSDISVTALTRDRNGAKAKVLQSLKNVEVVEIDTAQPETLIEPMKNVQAVMVSTPWNNLLENEINVINAAIQAKVDFLLKISTTATTMHENSAVGYARKHLLIEKYLKESGKINWAALRPNEFIENRLGLSQVLQHADSFPSMQGAGLAAMISTQDIGQLAAKILVSNDYQNELNGKSLVLSGPENTSDKVLADLLTEKLGREIEYQEVSEEQMAKIFFGEQVPSEIVAQMKEFNENVQDGKHRLESLPTDHLLLRIHSPTATIDNIISENIESFR